MFPKSPDHYCTENTHICRGHGETKQESVRGERGEIIFQTWEELLFMTSSPFSAVLTTAFFQRAAYWEKKKSNVVILICYIHNLINFLIFWTFPNLICNSDMYHISYFIVFFLLKWFYLIFNLEK